MTPRFPVGPVLLLVALVCGIALGEAAGPGDARVALAAGVLGASAALVIPRPRVRLVVGLLACALLGTALMQRALHGLVVSPIAAPIAARADVTASLTLLDDPDGSRFARRSSRVSIVSRSRAVTRTRLEADGCSSTPPATPARA